VVYVLVVVISNVYFGKKLFHGYLQLATIIPNNHSLMLCDKHGTNVPFKIVYG
jgi:hypothetical protein